MNATIERSHDDRVLILTPTGRDDRLLSDLLRNAGIRCEVCKDITGLTEEVALGAGAVLVAQEALRSPSPTALLRLIRDQPTWSDLPIILLTYHEEDLSDREHEVAELGNVLLLERPIGIEALLSVVRTALRARARQYLVRDYLEDRERAQAALREERGRLEILNRLGLSLSQRHELHDVVQFITDAATELVGASFGAFFYNVISDTGETYSLYTLSGVDPQAFAGFPMPRNTEIFAPTFQGSGTIRIDDVLADPRYGNNSPYQGMPPGHLPVRSYLAVPVISLSGEILGGLFLGHPSPGVFGPDAESLLVALSSQAATSLQNARLWDELKAERQKSETLIDAVPQLVWTCNERGECDYLSGQWLEYTGVSASDHLVYGWTTSVHPDDLSGVLEEWHHAQETKTFDVQFRLLGADGIYRWFATRATPMLSPDGLITKWFGTCTDIDDQKASEAALVRANHLKDELLALVSHELRTPLTQVLGAADVLRVRERELSEETRAALYGDIVREARRLQQRIENMLVLAKSEVAQEIAVEPILLDKTVTRVLAEVQTVDPRRPIKLSAPSRVSPALGNAAFVEQILVNLVRNSEKYADPGSEIEVEIFEQKHSVGLQVCDRGRKFAPEDVERMFEPFFRDESTATRVSGLGLGLPVCRRLAEVQGGTITALPRSDGGLMVRLTLPVADAEDDADLEPATLGRTG